MRGRRLVFCVFLLITVGCLLDVDARGNPPSIRPHWIKGRRLVRARGGRARQVDNGQQRIPAGGRNLNDDQEDRNGENPVRGGQGRWPSSRNDEDAGGQSSHSNDYQDEPKKTNNNGRQQFGVGDGNDYFDEEQGSPQNGQKNNKKGGSHERWRNNQKSPGGSHGSDDYEQQQGGQGKSRNNNQGGGSKGDDYLDVDQNQDASNFGDGQSSQQSRKNNNGNNSRNGQNGRFDGQNQDNQQEFNDDREQDNQQPWKNNQRNGQNGRKGSQGQDNGDDDQGSRKSGEKNGQLRFPTTPEEMKKQGFSADEVQEHSLPPLKNGDREKGGRKNGGKDQDEGERNSSNTAEMWDAVSKTAPATHAVLSTANRKVDKVYEESLDDTDRAFDEALDSIHDELPHEEKKVKKIKAQLAQQKKLAQEKGKEVSLDGIRKAVEVTNSVSDEDTAGIRKNIGKFMQYDGANVVMDGMSTEMPEVYAIMQRNNVLLAKAARRVQEALSDFVKAVSHSLRQRFVPLTPTINKLELQLDQQVLQLSGRTSSYLGNLIAYETFDMMNDYSPWAFLPFYYPAQPRVILIEPVANASLSGLTKRAIGVLESFRNDLDVFFNGQIFGPTLISAIPNFRSRRDTAKHTVDVLSKQMKAYLHKEQPKVSWKMARAMRRHRLAKEQLAETMKNATKAQQKELPTLMNSWFEQSPVVYSQATNLATSLSGNLQSVRNEYASYGYGLIMDAFGHLRVTSTPIIRMANRLNNPTVNLERRIQTTLPYYILQSIYEEPVTTRTALQQVIYYYMPVVEAPSVIVG